LEVFDYTEAELLYRQALEGRKRILGSDHPDTLQSVNNLGKALEKLDRLEEAEAQYREALDGRLKLLGQGHPHTLQSTEDLTSLIEREARDDRLEKAEMSLVQRVGVEGGKDTSG
jgi:tetratricopeptide (TPR) repeat protein